MHRLPVLAAQWLAAVAHATAINPASDQQVIERLPPSTRVSASADALVAAAEARALGQRESTNPQAWPRPNRPEAETVLPTALSSHPPTTPAAANTPRPSTARCGFSPVN